MGEAEIEPQRLRNAPPPLRPRPMSSTRTTDAEATRESPRSSRGRLIEAGTKLFRAQGYRRVSLDRILRESGVCRSNFYYHFRGKQDLALAVIDEWWQALQDDVMRPVLSDSRLGPLGKARAIVDEMIAKLESQGCRGGCPFGTLANAEAEHNERLRSKLVEVFDATAKVFEDLYVEARGCGELREDAPVEPELAATTLAFIQGGYLLSKTYVDCWRMRFAAQSWFDLVQSPGMPKTGEVAVTADVTAGDPMAAEDAKERPDGEDRAIGPAFPVIAPTLVAPASAPGAPPDPAEPTTPAPPPPAA